MAIFQNNCRETKYSLPKAATQIDLGVSHNALLSLDYELIITERKKETNKLYTWSFINEEAKDQRGYTMRLE